MASVGKAIVGLVTGGGDDQSWRYEMMMNRMQNAMNNQPSYTDPSVQAAALAQKKAAAEAAGRQSTILTGGSGDTSNVTTAKKALLGA